MRLRAFSLVELVIVVAIIGVIAAIAVPRMSRAARGACDAALWGNLATLGGVIDVNAAEHGGAYPGAEESEEQLIDQLQRRPILPTTWEQQLAWTFTGLTCAGVFCPFPLGPIQEQRASF